METIQFQLKDEAIRLCDLLKAAGIAGSGGQTVECRGVKLVVLAKPAQE